ncbi:hypothetical protein [Conexibacter arvalis]|uniref:Uncharacterized protein n=1 Tax=Conexibacter arvalis TaxID=912552 RepID=A0A840IE25_9ACTN|nr:hypothetical protein [Conexibacter arvalis]MBB4663032.1 hypothetical protein [Conexibacter arvalis]
MKHPPTDPPDLSDAPPDAVAALETALRRVAPSVPRPPAAPSRAALEAYVGDAVAIVYHGVDRDETLALLARLTALADAAARARRPGGDPPAVGLPPRLQRTLRRWERLRRAGAAGPRPTAAQLRERIELLGASAEPQAPVGADVVAIAAAELVAQELLAGPVAVESGMEAVRELEPIAAEGRALLRGTGHDAPLHVYVRPGATLAHLDHLLWQLESMTMTGIEPADLVAARGLWVEVAAALVFVHDASVGRAGGEGTWETGLAIAVDVLTLGDLGEAPEAYEWRGALALARSTALRFAGRWLDATTAGEEPAGAERERERIVEAAARALLGAWSAERSAQRSS